MKRVKAKCFRKYQDFYTAKDLEDPDVLVPPNLTIDDFDARGRIVNPPAPCVVTTIDPMYKEHAALHKPFKKFCVKTDILRLREITRKKFMIYSTQQMHLEKQREAELEDRIYQRSMEFFEFAENALKQMEADAFREMMEVNKHLQSLREVKLKDQLQSLKEEHQRVLQQLLDTYQKFQFHIKVIGYFDSSALEYNIQHGIDDDCFKPLPKPSEITEMEINDKTELGDKEVNALKTYMEETVKPYLAKRHHLDANVWIEGYELNRQKIFNYNRRFVRLALLNHMVKIMHDKFEKTHERAIRRPVYLRDATFLQDRVAALKLRANEVVSEIETNQKKDILSRKLDAIMPIVLGHVEATMSKVNGTETQPQAVLKKPKYKQVAPAKEKIETAKVASSNPEEVDTLSKVEKIQTHLFSLLAELDTVPPELCKRTERNLRQKIRAKKDMSRRALVKQNRLSNWIAHFKKHDAERRKMRSGHKTSHKQEHSNHNE